MLSARPQAVTQCTTGPVCSTALGPHPLPCCCLAAGRIVLYLHLQALFLNLAKDLGQTQTMGHGNIGGFCPFISLSVSFVFFTLKYMHAQDKHFRVQKSIQRPLSLPPGSLPTPITLPEAAHLTGSLCLLPDIFCVFGADVCSFIHCLGRQCKQPECLLTYNNPHFSVLQPSSIIPE